jgi:hypothetical protein
MLPMEAFRVISDYVVGRVPTSPKRVLIYLRDPLPSMVKNCKPSVLFSNKMLFYMKRSAIFLYKFVQ